MNELHLHIHQLSTRIETALIELIDILGREGDLVTMTPDSVSEPVGPKHLQDKWLNQDILRPRAARLEVRLSTLTDAVWQLGVAVYLAQHQDMPRAKPNTVLPDETLAQMQLQPGTQNVIDAASLVWFASKPEAHNVLIRNRFRFGKKMLALCVRLAKLIETEPIDLSDLQRDESRLFAHPAEHPAT